MHPTSLFPHPVRTYTSPHLSSTIGGKDHLLVLTSGIVCVTLVSVSSSVLLHTRQMLLVLILVGGGQVTLIASIGTLFGA